MYYDKTTQMNHKEVEKLVKFFLFFYLNSLTHFAQLGRLHEKVLVL